VSSETANRPISPDERYRLYIDESGDHVFNYLDEPQHRFLCLVGCWFRGADYRRFDDELRAFKQRHLPHSPDEPPVLHREKIINRRGPFWRLRDASAAAAFDHDLIELIGKAEFRLVAVVIDKKQLKEDYATPAHPYHLAVGFTLQRYCGFLNHVNRRGDVMAESRGGREDRLLKDSYARVYERGAWMRRGQFFQQALTTRELKLQSKSANIAGLQLADLLGNPVRRSMLIEKGLIAEPLGPFADRLCKVLEAKYNRHLYDGRIWGYGKVLFPQS
jgi:hypothetical protein